MAMIRHLLLNRENWDKTAIIDDKKYFSYRDIAQKAIAIGRQLPQKQGENIAIFLPNRGDYIAALFGTIMPGMKDCIIYGETDSLRNEIVCADIIPITGQVQTDQIRSYYKEHLANYKQPQRIKTIDAIRKTATSKIERATKDDQ